MTNNADIAKQFNLLADLMELHGMNPFKSKAYSSTAYKIKKYDMPVLSLNEDELEKIPGFGKGIVQRIGEIKNTGTITELAELLEKTPLGVVEMLNIKGIGARKIAVIWKELEVESVGELLYACNENRLVDLKGFGLKTQEQVKKQIEFMQASAGKFHYAAVQKLVDVFLKDFSEKHPETTILPVGQYRRNCEVIDCLEFLIEGKESEINIPKIPIESLEIKFHFSNKPDFVKNQFLLTGNKSHTDKIKLNAEKIYADEAEIYAKNNLKYIPPEMREGGFEFDWIKNNSVEDLIENKDLKGILHNHSTYSDGLHTLEEMATYCKDLGYEYFGICDHSQSAFYANGLKPERVKQQQQEIDELNKKLAPFRIFKGIESDILSDGSLDYEDEILASFDFIVASVHSNLRMDKEKATHRLIKAIENPYTTILGHPTGRLLLSREGYPIDHQKVIDACAANKVVIELNAHPFRLDIDWRWIHYAMQKNVMISINPDAHHKEGLKDMKYGVLVARKGGLTKKMCFNALSLQNIENYLIKD